MSRPALTLPSRTLQAVAQGLRQLHGTPSSRSAQLEELAIARGELELEREGWSFVWSGPKPLHNNVSDTWATITRLIEGAQTSLLIATHNIGLSRDCRDVFTSLAERLAGGSLKEVQIFFHPKQIDQELGLEPHQQISRWFHRKVWPWQPKPLAYIDQRLLTTSPENCYQHVKAVVADAGTPHAKALLTSANFSETAQRYNFEAGCLITLPWQVDKLAGHYRSLVDQGYFVRLL